jgi:VCBS repeat-containing protein
VGTLGSAVVVGSPAHGSLTLNPNGAFDYTPSTHYNGPDSFTYRASDGTVDTNVATVTLTVNAVNDAPTAAGDSYSTAEDTTLTVAAPGVLAGDADVDTDALTAILVSGPARGTLTLSANGAFVYTPTANLNGADAFTYKVNDGQLDSGTATVSIAVSPVNDRPTISDIADKTIDWNTNTGALAFTIGDIDGLTGVTVAGASSNPTLVPAANIVFAGTGAGRTVTVTPAANQSGIATITVTVTDAGGLSASDAFLLTVRRVDYTFVGLQNIPSPSGKTFKAGSSIPLGWRYQNGTTVVDSSLVRHEVTVVGPLPNPTINNTDSGQSSFRYSSGSWNFNLQTKTPNGVAFPVGTYEVTVKSLTTGFASSAPFTVKLVK